MSWRLRLISLIVLFFLVLVALSYHSGRTAEEPTVLEQGLLDMVAAGQNFVMSSARVIEDLWRGYFFLVNLREENDQLKKSLNRLHRQVDTLREADLANRRLREILNFKAAHDLPFLGAQIVGWDPNAWFKTITIDRGGRDGLSKGMPVVTDLGVVGRIVSLSPDYAQVLLIIDYNSSVDALVQRTRVRGIVAGRSGPTCQLKYVLKNDDLAVGDLIVTSGMGGVFPKGLPLGTVCRIKKTGQDIFQEVEITPAVDFNLLEEVLVILTRKPPLLDPGLSG